MGTLLVGAAGLMWGRVVVAGSGPGAAAASALRACRLGLLRGRGGSGGASRLLPGVTLGLVRIEV